MPCAKVTMPSCPSHAFVAIVAIAGPENSPDAEGKRVVYLSFFLGRSWLVWPHFFLRCGYVSRGSHRSFAIPRGEEGKCGGVCGVPERTQLTALGGRRA
jgi:hypothetical protein